MAKYKDQPRFIKTTAIDYTSVSTGPDSVASVFSSQCLVIRLAATSGIHYRVYDRAVTSVCTSADPILPPTCVELIGVQPGQNITFIKANIPTSADGRVTISEMA
jgi:hypothetical protein